MKVRRSYRLDNLADAAIKRMALDGGISEATVIERLALGGSNFGVAARKDELGARDSGKEPMRDPEQQVSSPAHAANLGIAPKGSFSKDDLKAMIAGGGAKIGVPEVDLQEHPRAPFDLNIEGERHRVAQMGKGGLWLFYLAEDGGRPVRKLAPGELETLWEKRHV